MAIILRKGMDLTILPKSKGYKISYKSELLGATFLSPKETREWGRRLAERLRPGDVLALVGRLGSGKTTLAQGIAGAWRYRRTANSPTFALVNEYQTPHGPVFHIDLYRLSAQELDQFPLEDYLDPNALCLIEWADRARSRWPQDALEVRLESLGEDQRQLVLPAPSTYWRKRLIPLFRGC